MQKKMLKHPSTQSIHMIFKPVQLVLRILIIIQVAIQAQTLDLTQEYITQLTAATQITLSSKSSFVKGDTNFLKDESLTSGIQTKGIATDPMQRINVDFQEQVYLGCIFVLVKESVQTAGAMSVHVYDTTFDPLNPSQNCGNLPFGGGVLNCGVSASKMTLFCPSGCSGAMAINMLRVWPYKSIADGKTIQIGPGTVFETLATIETPKIVGLGSWLSNSQGGEFKIAQVVLRPLFYIEMGSGDQYYFERIFMISEQASQSEFEIRIAKDNTEFADPSAGICVQTLTASVGYSDSSCNESGTWIVVQRQSAFTSLYMSKFIALGYLCIEGQIKFNTNIPVSQTHIVTQLDTVQIYDAPQYTFKCGFNTLAYSLYFTHRDNFTAQTGWVVYDSLTQKIMVTVTAAVLATADASGQIPLKISAYETTIPQTAKVNSDVLMVIQMQLACTPSDQIDLKYPALYIVAQRVTLTQLGETVNLAIPEYTTVCTQANPTIISFQIGGFGPPAWISVTDTSNFQVAPTGAIFEQFAGTLVQFQIVASNSEGSIANTDVTIELEFPTMLDLYCPLTSLELVDQASDTFIFSLSNKAEVFYAPLVKDSASIEKLGDPTGLIGCGDRQYLVISSSDNSYIDIDSVTQKLTLKDSVTLSDVGEHQVVVKVMLKDYPQVSQLLTLKIKIQVMPENGLDGQTIEPDLDPGCQVKSLTLTSFSTIQTLQPVIQLPQDLPLLLQLQVPVFGPLPFCGYTFQDVVYSLTDSRKQPYVKDSWLTYNKADHEIVIDISSAEVAPKQIRSVCILAKLSQKGIEKLTCFKIVPFGLDPESIIDGLIVEPDDYVDEVKEDELDSDTKVDTEQTLTKLFVNEKALHAQHMKELKKSFATEIGSRELSDETLTFKIESVSSTGKVILKFSEPVFIFDTLSNRTIDIQYCNGKNCDNLSNEPQKKLWVEVDIIAGESSDTAKLGFNSTMSFTDSETLSIELKFQSTLDVSLFSDEDKIRVKLWGPFVSSNTLAPISQANRVATKALPPQLKDDWAGQALSFIVDEDVMTSVTWSGIISSTARNLFVRGSLSNVFGMITGMQLIVHSPLINVQFPSNAFILYEELIHVATYEILPTSDIFPLFMEMPDRGFLNEKFERLDYGSFYSTEILGSVFILFLWQLSLIPFYYLLRLCRLRFMWPERMIRNLDGFLFWKQFLVFTYASFIEIVVCILLQQRIVQFPWLETFWVFVSFLLWICLIVQVIYIIGVSLFIVLPRIQQFETSQYLQRKYGFLVSNIDTKKGGLAMCFNLNYFVRRIALAIAAIYLEDYPACQIFILIFVDTLAMIMQGLVEPANTKSANRLALYDDLTLLLIIECLLCCTDFVSDAYGRYCVGYAIIFLTLQNLGVNLILLFATPVYGLILWLKRCYTIRQKTKGQTITYAKKQAKRSLQNKLTSLKNLVSSSRSKEQSQRSAKSQTLHQIEEIDEDEFDSEEEKKTVRLPQIQSQKQNSNSDSDSSESSSDSQQSEQNDKCNFSIHSNRLDEQNSLRGLKESQRTEDSTTRNIILIKKHQANDSFQSPEKLRVKFEKSPKSGKIAPGKEHLMNKLMTVEYIDKSSTHRGSSHPDALILSPNKRRSSYKQKHQNFSQMIQDSKPIGASVEDVVNLDASQRMRLAQVQKVNSIYLGENQNSSNSMLTASHEKFEPQMFSPSQLAADIVRIENGLNSKQHQVPKLNFDTPVRFNVGVDNFKIDSQSCLSNYSGKKYNVTQRDSVSSHASLGDKQSISPQKRHSSLLVVGQAESRSATARSPQNNSKDKRKNSVDLLSVVSGSNLSNYKAKRPQQVQPFKFQNSSVLGDSFSAPNMSQDNKSQQDSNHLSVTDNHRMVQAFSTAQAFNIGGHASGDEKLVRKKIMYATTLNNLGPVTELMSPIKEEMSPEKKRQYATLNSQSASKHILLSDRLILKATAKPSKLMKQASMAGFSQSKSSGKHKGMPNSAEKYRENPQSIGNICLQFADEQCNDNAFNLSPSQKQSQKTLHHLGPAKLRLSPRSMNRRQSDGKSKKAGTNTLEELPNLGFDQMLKAYEQSSNMSKVSAKKEESVQQCFNIAINEPDQEPIVITPVPIEKRKFAEMTIPINVAAMEQSGSELNLSL